MLPVLILAGGLATRMRPMTEKIPKALIEVAGKPFIIHQLEYLRNQGIKDIVLSIGYLGDMVCDLLSDGSSIGVNIEYSFDGDSLLGTGGAVKKALGLLDNEFFVLYGDSFLPINFLDVERAFKLSNKPALMTVFKNNNKWDVSNVLFENQTLLEYNKQKPNTKMAYIDFGLSLLSRSVFTKYQSNIAFDLAEVYHELSIKNNLAGYEVHERFYEVGSVKGLKETEEYFLRLKE